MAFVNFVLAISPIAMVLIGIMTFKKPAMKVAPVALIWAMFLCFTYFNGGDLSFKENVAMLDGLVWKGIKDNGYREGDFVTFTGWLKDMPAELYEKSTEFGGSDGFGIVYGSFSLCRGRERGKHD